MAGSDLVRMSPRELVRFLLDSGIRRFHIVPEPDTGVPRASHAALAPLAELVASDRRDHLGHEGLFFQVSREHPTLQGAFVHRTCRGQAAGGVRFWSYDSVEDYLRDGLRLAVGMTRKNALAGLWWGGGKGVMARDPGVDARDAAVRASLYREYGELMTALRGCYVTAEDVGTSVEDMAHVFATTRFTTCIPPALGGSGNPSVPTARGVIAGMEAALEHAGTPGLAGRSVAVQGTGHVGEPLIRFLLERGVERIEAADVDPAVVDRVRADVADPRLVARAVPFGDDSILAAACDILAPCATGAVLNPRTIPTIRARVVCGAANNQLEDPERDDRALHARGVLYVPDFLTNRMGIVTCADEQAGYVPDDPILERHLAPDGKDSIRRTVLEVLATSRSSGEPPSSVATAIADRRSLELHPVFGHRGAAIVRGLVADRWFDPPR